MWAREKEWQDEWKGGRFALLWTVEMCALLLLAHTCAAVRHWPRG
jgi:hypothetical protein